MTLQLTVWEREKKRERECEVDCSGWGVPISFLSLIYFSLLSKFLVSFKLLIIKVEVALLIIGDCLSIDWSDATRRLRKNENKKRTNFTLRMPKCWHVLSATPPTPSQHLTHTHIRWEHMCKRCCSFTPSTSPEVTPPFAVSLSSVCVCVLRFALNISMHARVCLCIRSNSSFSASCSHTPTKSIRTTTNAYTAIHKKLSA